MRMAAAKQTNAIPQYCIGVSDTCDFSTRKQLHTCMKAASPYRFALLSESQAVSLDYYASNQDVQQTVLFIDYGHSKLSAYIVKFGEDHITTLLKVGNHNLGVRNLDNCLYEYLKTLLKSELTKKREIRLRQIASKTRMILSANSQHHIHEELGDEDIEAVISRQRFEQLCLPVFEQIYDLLLSVREKAQKLNIKADSIEILGGGSRIPKFQQIVGTVLEWPIRKTVNSSEAVARGCSLYLKKLQNRSKLAKLRLRHKLLASTVLFINSYGKQPIGRLLDLRSAEQCQKHPLYSQQDYQQDKIVYLEVSGNSSHELWIHEQSNQLLLDYVAIKPPNCRKNSRLQIHISCCEYGFPKISKVLLVNTISYEEREIELTEQSQQQIATLRSHQRQLLLRDQQTTSNHQKLNLIHSEIYRLKNQHPQLNQYLQHLQPEQYDDVLQQISRLKSA